jgi:hypothetical protein
MDLQSDEECSGQKSTQEKQGASKQSAGTTLFVE